MVVSVETVSTRVCNVLIDRLVDIERPDLRSALVRHHRGCRIGVFDFLSAPISLTEASKQLRPDLVVVANVWLYLTPLLDRIMVLADCQSAAVVIASRNIDDVFRVQAAHRGFSNHVDLNQPADLLVERLFALSGEMAEPSAPGLWGSVPFPAMSTKGIEIARDAIDREILDLVSVGMQDTDIADVVHVSTQTVKNRISAMLERSGYRNRTQLAWMHSSAELAEAMLRGLSPQSSAVRTTSDRRPHPTR